MRCHARPAAELVTPSTIKVVSLYEAKGHLRIDDDVTDDDASIALMIDAATQDCEGVMQRAILPGTWRVRLADWADEIELSPAGVSAVTEVRYVDADGTDTVLDPSGYLLDSDPYRPALTAAYGVSWPIARSQAGSIRITYTAGTWADAYSVPASIKSWILLRVGALYENREAWTLGKPIEHNAHIDGLLARWRVYSL